ncbi:MAG: hypothetical protein DHS20C17_28850 [Cyclobacteriaceae bacterium]|nr:MAG: hypothetical protein DHS20C17_28850 [Cyclobacteriaceae bacterium]
MEQHPEGIKVHRFYLSYKINGEVSTGWYYGMHIRFAKDQLLFQQPDATDIMDWTYENSEDLKSYLIKQNATKLSVKIKLKNQPG